MKKRLKIKQLLLGIGLSILGLLSFSNSDVGAIGFNPYQSQNRIQDSRYIYTYNGIPYYSYGGANYRYNPDTQQWNQFGGTTTINGSYTHQVGDYLYYFGGATNRLYRINPTTDSSWSTFTTSNTNFYGDYMFSWNNNLYYVNGASQYVFNPSDNSWSQVTWSGLTTFYGNNVFTWNNNLYYMAGQELYIKTEGSLSWSLVTNSLGISSQGADVWFYQGDLYFTNSNNASVTNINSFSMSYKFNTSTNTFESFMPEGNLHFGGRMVYYINNEPYFAYYYTIYKLNYVAGGNITEEDVEEAYNQGYNEGNIIGSNNGLMISSCTFNNLITGPCGTQYYTLTNGSIDFDSLNDYVYNLGTGNSYSITFTFTDSISADSLLYARFKETEGSYISFYNDNTLLETLYNSDFDSNQSDYYKTFRLSDFGQITSSFNKIVINNISYDYSISEFGVLQNQSYNLGEENGEIYGYNSGFANGNIVGYERGYKDGEERGNNIVNLVGTVFTQPVNMLATIFNFEFLGINLSGFIFSLVTLLVVIWLIKRFI